MDGKSFIFVVFCSVLAILEDFVCGKDSFLGSEASTGASPSLKGIWILMHFLLDRYVLFTFCSIVS